MQPEKSLSHALPINYELAAYKIEGYLGEGGFGITYLARHNRLQDLVAIKEYFPSEFSLREQDSTVIPKSSSQETYAWGLERFLNEAKILIRFKHPHIIMVRDYFEMNGTGYIVMDYEVGQTFKAWLKEQFFITGEPPLEKKLLDIIIPILDALTTLHEEKFLHRDIKPDNIYIRTNGTPVLLDFGASRQALGDKSQSLSMILSPGYAPKEQYSSRGNFGPWTDIYAVCATLYYAVTGHKLPSSTDRGDARDEGEDDPLIPAQEVCKGQYSTHFLQAIDAGLAYLPKDRPQTAKEFQIALQGEEYQKTSVDDDRTIVLQTKTKTATSDEVAALTEAVVAATTFLNSTQKLATKELTAKKTATKQTASNELELASEKTVPKKITVKKITAKKSKFKKINLSYKNWLTIVVVAVIVIGLNLFGLKMQLFEMKWALNNLVSGDSQAVKQPEVEAALQKAQADMENGGRNRQKSAIKSLTDLAEKGDADAMRLLGVAYYQGTGVKQDYEKACQWYEQAADAGNKKAQNLYQEAKECDTGRAYRNQLKKLISDLDWPSVKANSKELFYMIKKAVW